MEDHRLEPVPLKVKEQPGATVLHKLEKGEHKVRPYGNGWEKRKTENPKGGGGHGGPPHRSFGQGGDNAVFGFRLSVFGKNTRIISKLTPWFVALVTEPGKGERARLFCRKLKT